MHPSVPDPALECFPHLPILPGPTPLQEAPGLRAALGPRAPRILIKRDDLTGLALGGNKVRKLEYLLADARQKGADLLITCGAAQSNHALQTAAAARRFGFDVHCVLYGSPPAPDHATGNVLLHTLLDTDIRWARLEAGEKRAEQALRRALLEEEQKARAAGRSPYCIPTGGSTPIGALGYVRAMAEIREQLNAREDGPIAALFFASGSGGTQAGMVIGAQRLDWKLDIVGIEIDPIPPDADGVSPFERAVRRLAIDTEALLTQKEGGSELSIHLCPDYAGLAYGAPDERTIEAIRLLARTEGIFIDPVYTGKALAALIGWVREGRFTEDDTILFWHTGGTAGLFSGH